MLVVSIVLTGGVLRIWFALHDDDGLYSPDEIDRSLEPAHRLVFGLAGG